MHVPYRDSKLTRLLQARFILYCYAFHAFIESEHVGLLLNFIAGIVLLSDDLISEPYKRISTSSYVSYIIGTQCHTYIFLHNLNVAIHPM